MEPVTNNKTFNRRAFVSTAMIIAILILPVSGIMNHVLQFSELTPARHFWMSVHNAAASMFVILAVIHLSLNGRALVHYLSAKGKLILSKESFTAAVLVAGIVFLFASHAYHVR
jgi:hypothetical protein